MFASLWDSLWNSSWLIAAAGFLFFALKGILWLTLPLMVMRYRRRGHHVTRPSELTL